MYERELAELSRSGARYLVIGAVAMGLQGYPHANLDLDILSDLSAENLDKIIRSLTELGYCPRLPIEAEELKAPAKRDLRFKERNMKVFSFIDPKNPLNIIDVMIYHPLDFEKAYRRRKNIKINGMVTPVASVEDLLILKKEASRKRDAHDIAILENLIKRNGK